MNVISTTIPDVLIVEPPVYGDERGFFIETWQQERYAAFGIDAEFVQDNQSYSKYGVLRGLHVQHPFAQGKLVSVSHGEVFDVAVDVRHGSPFFGQWVGCLLTAQNKRQLWIPKGFAHGYLVTSTDALFTYKCSDYYHPETQFAIRWNDPAIGIVWPQLTTPPTLSIKDAQAALLADIAPDLLPAYSM